MKPIPPPSTGWLSTKKRGRDDAEIAASRKRALMRIQTNNNNNNNNKTKKMTTNGKNTKNKTVKKKVTKKAFLSTTTKRRRNDNDSLESSSSSIDDFIASDDDDEGEDDVFIVESENENEDHSSEEEEDSVHRRSLQKSTIDLVGSDSDDTDRGQSTFLPSTNKTRPPPKRCPFPQTNKAKAIQISSTKTLSSKGYSTMTPKTMELSSPESQDYLTSPTTPILQKPNRNNVKIGRKSTNLPGKMGMEKSSGNGRKIDHDDSSDDSDVLLVLPDSGLVRTGGPNKHRSLSSSSSSSSSPPPMTKTTSNQKNRRKDGPSVDSLISTSTATTTSNGRTTGNKNALVSKHPFPSPQPSASATISQQKPSSIPQKHNRPNPFAQFALTGNALQDTDDDSDDEQVAIQLAIKKSLKDQQAIATKKRIITKKQPPTKAIENRQNPASIQRKSTDKEVQPSRSKVDRNAGHDDVIIDDDDDDEEPLATEEMLNDFSSSSEDENGNGDEDDEVHDSREHKVATSVLETAASLSAQVLATMNQWTTTSSTTDDNAAMTEGTSAPHGMIVDGALSLGTISSTGPPPASQWISQETMQQACPGVTLSKYQLIGVNWLALLHGMKCTLEQGSKDTPVNGVLADEMGLGKTAQTIAFLAWLKHTRRAQQSTNRYHSPHIIVVPVSVLPNWMREFETFAPHMKVIKYHGSMAEREVIQDELQKHLPGRRQYPDDCLDALLVPVTYYQKEKSDDRRFLNKFKFDYLVVDEAHMLKNSLSTRYKMLNKLNTQHRLLLTGTPVQNSPQELLNMLCFIMPLFSKGSESFEDDDEGTSVGDRMLQHFVDAEQEKSGDERVAYAKLKQLFAPFVLRRKKDDVIAQLLPSKTKVVEYVELDDAGRKIYNSILEDHIHKNGAKTTTTVSIGEHLFTNLRKAAHHPLLLRTRHNTPTEVEHLVTYFHKYQAFAGEGSTKAKVGEELSKYNDFQIHLTALELVEENPRRRPDLERYILDESALFSSAKFSRLRTLLPDLIHKGHRVLIFSGWTSCLDLLGCLMEQLDVRYLRMDGSCPSDIRQARIDEFNGDSSIPVFLLSTRACGLGINLTTADTCIMHDLDFNPFNDLQAEDRCHRIGQTKPVTVFKFVSKDTVDADIFEMQERKAKMNAAIMESSTNKSMEVGKQERKAILQSVMQKFLSPQDVKSQPLDRLVL